jgi:hypothetical protein
MLTDEEREDRDKKSEERLRRDADRFRANIAIPRPGTKAPAAADVPVLKRHGVELSDLLYVETQTLHANPLNTYPPLVAEELAELVHDIKEKGVLVPLITRLDGTIVCGHNRHTAAIAAELARVPVQRILSPLTDDLEREIMKSENDRRRGGNWTAAKKEEFVREHFGVELQASTHGGIRGNQYTGGQGSVNLAREIEKKSKGRIPEGTAKRLVAKIRKEAPVTAASTLSDTDRKRGEKLALQLKTIRQTRAMLEKKLAATKEEESRLVKELKTIGQPELFGV